ncbi:MULTISPECIES: exodeoxyribonuclease V subunit gamma [Chitinophagaceae]
MSLHLEVSNSLEILSDRLIEKIRQGKKNVFTPITIVTQTEGMNLWLREYIAKKMGIAANIHFITPNDIVFRIFQLLGGAYKETISRESLIWILYKVLGEREFAQQFPEQISYFQNPVSERDRKRMGMATKMADLFDQYQIYRQNIITKWNNAPVKSYYRYDDWQEYLWKKIKTETAKDIQDKTLVKEWIDRNISNKTYQQTLQKVIPEIYLFGLSIFTNYHLDILKKVAGIVDVRFFLLNPAPQIYWMDDASNKQIAKWRSHKNGKDESFLTGNPILTNWGKVLQNTFRLMFRSEDIINNYDDSHVAMPKEDTLLHKLQANIFYNNVDDNIVVTKKNLEDGTLSIHSNYTIAAEVDALYQYLVHLVDNKKVPLSARDISVMVSDIDKYEPYIRAVFDNAPYPFKYKIADVSVSDGDTIYSALRLLLELNEHDFTSEKVLQLLESAYIRKRFKLSNTEYLRTLVKTANIRFGIEGNTEDDTYIVSWRYGIQRLMYGVCMTGEPLMEKDGQYFYPLDIVEGNSSQYVVRFSHFVEMLIEVMKRRQALKTPTEWIGYVQWLVDNLIYQVVDTAEEDYYSLKEHLGQYKDLSGMQLEAVPFEVFRMSFLSSLDATKRTSLFINDGITFCSLIPMRSVPFKVIALLGMNAKDFPRKEKPLSFSLLQQTHVLGDRNIKDNDKHLFLETLISAKEYLFISYVGRSVKDNTVLPPSVLVEELIDYIQTLTDDSKLHVTDYIVTQHPLHTYSSKYNNGNPKLYRYSKKENEPKTILGTTVKTLPGNLRTDISLPSLIAFFKNAPKVFYNRVFGVYYEDSTILLPETEIFHLDSLDNAILKNEMLALSHSNLETWKNKLKLKGQLPLKNVGAASLETLMDAVAPVHTMLAERFPDIQPDKHPVQLIVGDISLTGEVSNVYGDSLVAVCFSKNARKHFMSAYIDAIAGMAMDIVHSMTFILVDPKNETEIEIQSIPLNHISPKEAQTFLETLVQLYQQGMNAPYPFSDMVYYDMDFTKAGQMDDDSLKDFVTKKINQTAFITADPYSTKSYNEGIWSEKDVANVFRKTFHAIFEPIRKLYPELFDNKKP